MRDFLDSVKEDVCLIPNKVLAGLLQEKEERDDKLYSVLNRIATTMETGQYKMIEHFQKLELKMDQLIIAKNDTSEMETSLFAIGEKLDKLTEAVTNSTINQQIRTTAEENERTKKNVMKLKDLRGQYLRAEKMIGVSEELMNKSPPYVQSKFRMKVSKDLPNEELNCYRADALHNAQSENEKMRIRMRRWEDEITQRKSEITAALEKPNVPHQMKTRIEQQIMKDEEMNQIERENAIKKIKDTFHAEYSSGATQFLLKFVEDHSDADRRNRGDRGGRNSKNFREERPYRRPWRKPWYSQ